MWVCEWWMLHRKQNIYSICVAVINGKIKANQQLRISWEYCWFIRVGGAEYEERAGFRHRFHSCLDVRQTLRSRSNPWLLFVVVFTNLVIFIVQLFKIIKRIDKYRTRCCRNMATYTDTLVLTDKCYWLQESCAIAKITARCTIWQYAPGLQLESPFLPSCTNRWAVRAKIRQKRPSRWP